MQANLATMLTDRARSDPARIAVRLDEVELSYADLDAASARVAALVGERIEPGGRVGVLLPNVPYFPLAYYGVLRAGGVVVPMNVLLTAREIAYALEDSGAGLLLAWHGFLAEAEAGAARAGAEVVEVRPGDFERLLGEREPAAEVAQAAAGDTAVVIYTSGTTGTPKGAELSHGSLRRNAEIMASDLAELTPDDVVLGALPLFHSFGQTCAMNAAVQAGSCLTLLPRFEPGRALEVMARDRVTVFEGVPTMYVALVGQPERARFDLSALRRGVSGGAPIPAEVLRAAEEAFGITILEGYGLSETSPVASFNHPDRPRKATSIGTPIREVEMRVVDADDHELPPGEVGEIVIRGHNLFKGYWRRPQDTAEAMRGGWFHTGDLARVDEDGYFFIVDRKKDMILRGGFNVYPREVEELLYAHPAVTEAAVVGIPDERLGEEVGAAVALRDGQEVDADELRAFLRPQLAPYKCPRRIWFVTALPKGPTGKILKREIVPPPPPERDPALPLATGTVDA